MEWTHVGDVSEWTTKRCSLCKIQISTATASALMSTEANMVPAVSCSSTHCVACINLRRNGGVVQCVPHLLLRWESRRMAVATSTDVLRSCAGCESSSRTIVDSILKLLYACLSSSSGDWDVASAVAAGRNRHFECGRSNGRLRSNECTPYTRTTHFRA